MERRNHRPQVSLFYFIIFMMSVSIVIIVYTLPFSEIAYIRVDHIIWLLLFIVSFFAGALSFKQWSKYPSASILIIFCLICLASTMSIFATKITKMNVYSSLFYQMAMYQCALVFLITLSSFPIEKRETFINWVIFMGVMLSIIGLLQFLYILPPHEYIAGMGNLDNRATALLSFNSLHLATYLVTSVLLGYGVFLQQKSFITKGVLFISLLLMIIVLILTKARSAWLGFLIGNIIFALVTLKMTNGKSIILIMITFIVLSIGIFYMGNVNKVVNEAVEKRDSSAIHRLITYDLFFDYIKNHPLVLVTGVGFMNWRYALTGETASSAGHNVYLQILGDLGIGGLLLFLWFWYRNFKMAAKLARDGDFWGRMLLPIIGAYLATCLTSDILYPGSAMENCLFFIMLITGVVLSAYDAETPSVAAEKAVS